MSKIFAAVLVFFLVGNIYSIESIEPKAKCIIKLFKYEYGIEVYEKPYGLPYDCYAIYLGPKLIPLDQRQFKKVVFAVCIFFVLFVVILLLFFRRKNLKTNQL